MKTLFLIILGIAFLIFGIVQFKKSKLKHDSLDSVADARVTNVIDLGIGNGGKRVFAVEYTVLAEEKFKLLETPTRREPDVDDMATVYYEKKAPKENFYITYKWNFDPRFKVPILMIIIGIIFILGSIFPIIKYILQ